MCCPRHVIILKSTSNMGDGGGGGGGTLPSQDGFIALLSDSFLALCVILMVHDFVFPDTIIPV